MKTTRRALLNAAAAATIASATGAHGMSASASDHNIPRLSQRGRKILIKSATAVTMDPTTGDMAKGDILVEGSKITKIAPSIEDSDADIIDAAHMIAIPGFVDTHRHAWEGQLRRINPNSSNLHNYLEGTHLSFAPKYRPMDMYIGNLLTSLGCIDAGITTIIDNSHNSRSIEHANAAIDALEASGIRAVHAPGAPLAGDWEKERWFDDLATLQKTRFANSDALVSMAMMTTLDVEQWKVGRELGLDLVTEFFGMEMSEMLIDLDKRRFLGPHNIFNHCTGLSGQAWDIIKNRGIRVNVCPRSDTHWALESGFFGYQDAIDHGLRPGLSVDNESAYSGDMFSEMRTALYLQRSAAQARKFHGDAQSPAPVGMRSLLEAATIDGARVAGLADKIGSLTEGKEADIVLINANDINLYPSSNALGTVVSGADRGNVDTVLIGGKIRKRNGKIVGLDLGDLKEATEESRNYLFSAVGFEQDEFADHFTRRS